MADFPFKGGVEVGKAGGELGADVVEGGGGVEVRAYKPCGIGLPLGRIIPVDVVSTEGRNLLAVNNFRGTRSRPRKGQLLELRRTTEGPSLSELSCYSGDSDNRNISACPKVSLEDRKCERTITYPK